MDELNKNDTELQKENKVGKNEEKQLEKLYQEEVESPFRRSGKISRSPARPRTHSLTDLLNDERRHKRPREETPPKDKKNLTSNTKLPSIRQKIQKLIDEAQTEISKATLVIQAIPNTKKEIKDAITKMNSIVAQLKGASIRQWLDTVDKPETSDPYRDKAEEAKLTERVKSTAESGSQTEETEPIRLEELAKRNKIKIRLDTINSVKEFNQLAEINWPEGIFERVSMEEGNPLSLRTEDDLAVYVEDKEMEKGIGRTFRERYPELADLKNPGAPYIVTTVKMPTLDRANNSRYVFKVIPKDNTEEGVREETLIRALFKLKKTMVENERKRIHIPIPDNYTPDYLRKCLEYIFRDTDIAVALHIPKRMRHGMEDKQHKTQDGQNPQGRNKTVNRTGTTEAIILSSEGKTYAELLREVKTNIKPKEIGVEIQNVRRTRNGNMILTIEGGRDKLEPLKLSIENKLPNISARTTEKKQRIFHIYDIDPVTTKEEVKTEVEAALQAPNSGIEIRSMRPCGTENQAATVIVDPELGEKMKNTRFLKIGWSSCRVKERISVERCRNCLQYGHPTKTCKRDCRAQLCYNCGEEGHQANQCKKEPYCFDCNKKAHKSGTTKCPVYQKVLREAKTRNN